MAVEVDCCFDGGLAVVDVDGSRADEPDGRVGEGGGEESPEGVCWEPGVVVDHPDEVRGRFELADVGEARVEAAAASEVTPVADEGQGWCARVGLCEEMCDGPCEGGPGRRGGAVLDGQARWVFVVDDLRGVVVGGVVDEDDLGGGVGVLGDEVAQEATDGREAVPGDDDDGDVRRALLGGGGERVGAGWPACPSRRSCAMLHIHHRCSRGTMV